METELPEGFVGMLTTATSTQKKAMLKLLSESIAADELNLGVVAVYSSESVNSTAAVNGEVSAVTHLPPPPPPNRDPAYLKTLAEHVEDIGIHETLSDSIISEFHSLNLTGDRLKTQWLSPTRESYNYAAVVNHPKQIKEFPAICKLMELVNDHPSTTGDLDSALVTRYPKASSALPVLSGVPQGSILGPLLFVLFINDMFLCVSKVTNIALYADDTKIWRRIESFTDHHCLQDDIKNLFDWSTRNKMVFHPSKCKALSISKKRNVFDNLPFNIFIYELNGILIDYVETHKDLGVIVDSKLNWGPQYDNLLSNSISKLGILKRTCHFTTDTRQKRAFYLAIVRSLFEHCSTIWSPQYKTNLLKFSAIQRRAVKWINGEQFASYSEDKYNELLRKHQILPIKMKFIYNDLVMFYKIVNHLTPVELPDYITVCEPENTRFTRHTASVHNSGDNSKFPCSVKPNCDAFKQSFFCRSLNRWNNLPLETRQAKNLISFKALLKNLLWSPDTEWPD